MRAVRKTTAGRKASIVPSIEFMPRYGEPERSSRLNGRAFAKCAWRTVSTLLGVRDAPVDGFFVDLDSMSPPRRLRRS